MIRCVIASIALAILCGCASATQPGSSYFLVATGTVALDKRPWQGKGNHYPWDSETGFCADGVEWIIVSNSCGFADVTFRAMTVQEYVGQAWEERGSRTSGREIAVALSMGEWCHVRQIVVDEPTLLYVDEWQGQLFGDRYASIYFDEQRRPLVVDEYFIEFAGLTALTTALRTDPGSETCFPAIELTSDFMDNAEGPLIQTPEGACFSHGVYLKDLPAATPFFPFEC